MESLPKSQDEMMILHQHIMQGKNMPIYVGLAGMLGLLSFAFIFNITRPNIIIQPTFDDIREIKDEVKTSEIE
jgi:hypothetical protein